MSQRDFGPKKRKGKRNGGSGTDSEAVTDDEATFEAQPEPVQQQQAAEVPATKATPAGFSAATAAQPAEQVPQELFAAFTVGDIKRIDSTPDHKPPIAEDTIEGRYASVLFTSASQTNSLFNVYEDITYIQNLYKNSESFRLFTQNQGVGAREIRAFNKALLELGDFNELTIKFLEVLAENKRLIYIEAIAGRYQKLYQLFNKEEKITIISAEALSNSEEQEVLAALKANPQNEGKEFTLDFTVDPTIRGGLQMYTETEFMDMSLSSRIEKLRNEVTRLID